MKNTTQNSLYNPCERMTHRGRLCRCSFEKRTACSQFIFSKYLNMVENGGFKVPDDVLVDILRSNGGMGRLGNKLRCRFNA